MNNLENGNHSVCDDSPDPTNDQVNDDNVSAGMFMMQKANERYLQSSHKFLTLMQQLAAPEDAVQASVVPRDDIENVIIEDHQAKVIATSDDKTVEKLRSRQKIKVAVIGVLTCSPLSWSCCKSSLEK